MSIRLRALRLLGASRTYGVDFTADGNPRPLSVIAGQISTGKTSVLEFVDFCLGASRHPPHLEVRRRVRSIMLEVDLAGETVVIERPAFSSDQTTTVHRCPVNEIGEPHTIERRPLTPPGDPSSLSALLREASGLEGIQLKEAPTQARSATDPLSFRDVMPLCFLPNQRIDNRALLLETNHMRALKLRQVIEVIFEVYDDQLAVLGDQLARVEQERRDLAREVAALDTFLRENDVAGRLELDAEAARLEEALQTATAELNALSARMQAETTYARESRDAYARARRATGEAAARLRDRETLLRRLLPLRGQYAEDERKLTFFHEAQRLFDPLRVQVCPACLQELPNPVEVRAGGSCSLCHQHIATVAEPIDIESERNAVRARLRSIEAYIQEVEEQLGQARAAFEEVVAAETAAQRRLDSQVATDLSPFLAQRDELVRRREALRAERANTTQQVRWREGLERRHNDDARLEARATELRERITALRERTPDRQEVVRDLSSRFGELLRTFGLPKLDTPEAPYLDETFTPWVRGNRYGDIGSTGAMTLISLAWQLTLFERAVEQAHHHPGFLMIDSPQKNLVPEGSAERDEFTDPEIVERVWRHLIDWSSSMAGAAQLVVVDNRPPAVADPHVAVRYSGRPDEPPYGLIEDETG